MKSGGFLEVFSLPTNRQRGILRLGTFTFPCALGRSGIKHNKKEGDGVTPTGSFELLNVLYRPDKGPRPRTSLPVDVIDQQDGWCDDPTHPAYNRPVQLPFAASHEKMWREDRLYDIVVVLDCNMYPPIAGKGSAIFFHIAREDYRPTEGCVAVAPQHMRILLEHVGPGAVMRIR